MIRVNDRWDIDWRQGMTVQEVLAACRFTYQHVVVSLNGALVPAEEYGRQLVADGDHVRVIHVIAGG